MSKFPDFRVKLASKDDLSNPEIKTLGIREGFHMDYRSYLEPTLKMAEEDWVRELAEHELYGKPLNRSVIEYANKVFWDNLKAGNFSKIAEETVGLIRTHIFVKSVLDRILPPIPTTVQEVIPDDQVDMVYMLVARQKYLDEQKWRAFVLPSMDANVPRDYVAPRVRLNFFPFESDEFKKNDYELLSYEAMNLPLVNFVSSELQESLTKKKDAFFWKYVNYALDQHADAVISHSSYGTSSDLLKQDFTVLMKYFADRKIPMGFFVAHHSKILEIQNWNHNDIGSLVSEVVINGVKFPSIFGYPVITTYNDEIVSTDELYAFAAPAYLGVQRMLEDMTVTTERVHRTNSFKASLVAGAVMVNEFGVAKVVFA